jgi:hypothetical protein
LGRNWDVTSTCGSWSSPQPTQFPFTTRQKARRQAAEERKLTMTHPEETFETTTIASPADCSLADAAASKKSTSQSEVRTVRAITGSGET